MCEIKRDKNEEFADFENLKKKQHESKTSWAYKKKTSKYCRLSDFCEWSEIAGVTNNDYI